MADHQRVRSAGLGLVACAFTFTFAFTSTFLRAAPAFGADTQTCVDAAEKGQVLRDGGQFLRARETLLACVSDACPKAVRADCQAWVEQLEREIPSFLPSAKTPDGEDLVDVNVFLDDKPIAARLDGRSMLADVGPHKIRFEAAGYRPVTHSIVLQTGQKNRLIEVKLEKESDKGTAASENPVVARSERPSRVLPLVLGSVAVTFGAVATGYAIAGISARDDLSSQPCGLSQTCSSDDLRPIRSKLLVADVLGAAAILAGAACVYFLVTQPSRPPPSSARLRIPGLEPIRW